MSVKLSFCIPTYNRAAFLVEAIESIIGQATDEVEIVISDNASCDNTEMLVHNYQRRFPRITYFRWAENMGADRNYLKAVELATGKYCWLMGSDDALRPGAVVKVLNEIKEGHDIYLCNRIECNIHLQPKKTSRWLYGQHKDEVFNLSNRMDLIKYFDKSRSLGSLFSYLSSIILNRETWNQIRYDEEFTGSAYAHAYMLMSFIKFDTNLKYLCEPLVLCRGENDSFMSLGAVRRFLLDIDAYMLLSDKLFGNDNQLRNYFIKVMRYERPWWYIARIRAASDRNSWKEIKHKLSYFGYGRHIFIAANLLGFSNHLMIAASHLRRILYRL